MLFIPVLVVVIAAPSHRVRPKFGRGGTTETPGSGHLGRGGTAHGRGGDHGIAVTAVFFVVKGKRARDTTTHRSRRGGPNRGCRCG
eukprot:scaffold44427_cov229-Amphora_coffeaeformis.AAC.2